MIPRACFILRGLPAVSTRCNDGYARTSRSEALTSAGTESKGLQIARAAQRSELTIEGPAAQNSSPALVPGVRRRASTHRVCADSSPYIFGDRKHDQLRWFHFCLDYRGERRPCWRGVRYTLERRRRNSDSRDGHADFHGCYQQHLLTPEPFNPAGSGMHKQE